MINQWISVCPLLRPAQFSLCSLSIDSDEKINGRPCSFSLPSHIADSRILFCIYYLSKYYIYIYTKWYSWYYIHIFLYIYVYIPSSRPLALSVWVVGLEDDNNLRLQVVKVMWKFWHFPQFINWVKEAKPNKPCLVILNPFYFQPFVG